MGQFRVKLQNFRFRCMPSNVRLREREMLTQKLFTNKQPNYTTLVGKYILVEISKYKKSTLKKKHLFEKTEQNVIVSHKF